MAGRRFIFLSIMLHFGLFVNGQNYFIYIQSENRSTFFVKWQDRAYNSSESGYLVVPRVSPGNHELTIGFTVDSWSVKKFNIRIQNKDAGFMLKKSSEDRWLLYNLQTTESIEAEGSAAGSAVPPPSDDAFVNILADVVENPSLRRSVAEKENMDKSVPEVSAVSMPVADTAKRMEIPKVEKGLTLIPAPEAQVNKLSVKVKQDVPEQKKETPVSGQLQKSVPVKDSKPVNMESKEPIAEATTAAPVKPAIKDSMGTQISVPGSSRDIQLVGNSLYGKERAMLYIVRDGLKTDTVDVWIEYRKKAGKEKKQKTTETVIEDKAMPESEVKKPLPESELNKQSAEVKEKVPAPAQLPSVASVPQPASYIFCKDTASAADFQKLRKRMANEDSEDLMLERARQAFRSKCYTIYQVRNLSYLFLDEEKRLMFLEASFPCVPDKVNFSSLENLLTDPGRIDRLQNLYRPKP